MLSFPFLMIEVIVFQYNAIFDPCLRMKQLDTLQDHIVAMRVRCEEAQAQLQDTNDSCRSLLDRAGSLREQRYVGVHNNRRIPYSPSVSFPESSFLLTPSFVLNLALTQREDYLT